MRVNAVVNAPCKQKHEKRPGGTLPPPYNFWGKRPGAELARHFSVRDRAFSEEGKRVLYIYRKVDTTGMWVVHILRNNTKRDRVRREQKTKDVLDVLHLENTGTCHPATRKITLRACIEVWCVVQFVRATAIRQMPTSCVLISRDPSAIVTPANTGSPVPNINISQKLLMFA